MDQSRSLRKSATLAPFFILASLTASAQPCFNGYCPPPAGYPGYPTYSVNSVWEADNALNMLEQYAPQASAAQDWLRRAIQPGAATCTAASAAILRHRQFGIPGLGPMEATQMRSCLIQSLAVSVSSLQGLPIEIKEQASREFLDVIRGIKSDDDLYFLSQGSVDSMELFRVNLGGQIRTLLDACLQVANDQSIEQWRRSNFASIVLEFSNNAINLINDPHTGMPYPGPCPMPGIGLSVPLLDLALLQSYQQLAQTALNPV